MIIPLFNFKSGRKETFSLWTLSILSKKMTEKFKISIFTILAKSKKFLRGISQQPALDRKSPAHGIL